MHLGSQLEGRGKIEEVEGSAEIPSTTSWASQLIWWLQVKAGDSPSGPGS